MLRCATSQPTEPNGTATHSTEVPSKPSTTCDDSTTVQLPCGLLQPEHQRLLQWLRMSAELCVHAGFPISHINSKKGFSLATLLGGMRGLGGAHLCVAQNSKSRHCKTLQLQGLAFPTLRRSLTHGREELQCKIGRQLGTLFYWGGFYATQSTYPTRLTKQQNCSRPTEASPSHICGSHLLLSAVVPYASGRVTRMFLAMYLLLQ